VRELGLVPTVTAQSPHLSGIQSAVRSGLGYTLLADGGDVARGPGDAPHDRGRVALRSSSYA
jgi:hypothetical protein